MAFLSKSSKLPRKPGGPTGPEPSPSPQLRGEKAARTTAGAGPTGKTDKIFIAPKKRR